MTQLTYAIIVLAILFAFGLAGFTPGQTLEPTQSPIPAVYEPKIKNYNKSDSLQMDAANFKIKSPEPASSKTPDS